MLAVHISNRFIDLKPVLERQAAALGKRVLVVETEDDESGRCYGTTWVLISSNAAMFELPEFQKKGQTPAAATWLPLWTDDYSNIFRVLR